MNTLEGLHKDVEKALESPEALARLVQALLEFEKEAPHQREYVAALIYYVFYRRRREIAKQRGDIIPIPDGRISSGCGPRIDWEVARAQARAIEWDLTQEIGAEAVRDFKKRVGKQLSLRECIRRIRERRFDA
jgi:hypothetical protein